MPIPYRHLFFDLDHTLWDFERNSEHSWRQLYDGYGLAALVQAPFDLFFRTYLAHNDRLWERYRKGFIKRDELRWKRVWLTLLDFKVYDVDLAHRLDAAYMELLPTRNALMPYAKELLEHCKGRYEVHLITNGFEATQWQKLRHSGIDGYFREVITSERSNSMKPYPEIFQYALNATGARGPECLMIGDALDIDVLGAANAGWDQVYYNPGKVPHSSKPTFEVAGLDELIGIL